MAKSNVPTVDPQSAIGVARTVLSRTKQADQAARFASLPPGEFDQRVLARYPELVEAAAAAATAYTAVLAQEGEALVPLATIKAATEVRARMFKVVEFFVADDIGSVRRQLDDIRAGTGYRDLASDLAALAELYREHAALVSGNPKYRESDVPDALRLAADLLQARTDRLTAPARKAAEKWGKAFGDLRELHEEICATGRWLERKSGDPNRYYPSLFSVADATSSSKKGKGKAAPPKPKTPVVG